MRQGRTVHISQGQAKCQRIFTRNVLWVLVFLLPFAMIYVESYWKEKVHAYIEVRGHTTSVEDDRISDFYTNKLVHLSSTNIQPDKQLYDWDFGLKAPGAL